METTIKKRIKGSVIEQIFESSNTVNVRYYNAKIGEHQEYDSEKVYTFDVKIRHNEDEDPKQLLEQEIKNIKQTSKL